MGIENADVPVVKRVDDINGLSLRPASSAEFTNMIDEKKIEQLFKLYPVLSEVIPELLTPALFSSRPISFKAGPWCSMSLTPAMPFPISFQDGSASLNIRFRGVSCRFTMSLPEMPVWSRLVVCSVMNLAMPRAWLKMTAPW